jgi:hypothetical protein
MLSRFWKRLVWFLKSQWRQASFWTIASVAILWIVVASDAFQSCIYDRENYKTYKASQESPSVVVRTVIWADITRACVGNFADKNQGALTVFSTFFIALFTYTLWRSTRSLSKDSGKQIRVAVRSARAAERAAKVAELALRSTQRAMVISPGFNTYPVWVKDIDVMCGIKIEARWKNTGVTPALRSENWIVVASRNISDQEEIEFDKLRGTPSLEYGAVIGPGIHVTTPKSDVSLEQLIDVFEKRKRLFVYSRAEYDDVFEGSPRHHTDVCVEVLVTDDPLFVRYIEGMSSSSFLGYKAHTHYNSTN